MASLTSVRIDVGHPRLDPVAHARPGRRAAAQSGASSGSCAGTAAATPPAPARSYMGYAGEQLIRAVPGEHHLDAELCALANSGTDTTALMMSPYSVSSDIRIAARTSSARMSPGRTSITSCRTPRSAHSRREYTQVVAAGRADGQRHAVRVHRLDVGEHDRAVQTAGQDHAHGKVRVDPDPDAVLDRQAQRFRRFGRIFDWRQVPAEPASGRRTARDLARRRLPARPSRDARAGLPTPANPPAPVP